MTAAVPLPDIATIPQVLQQTLESLDLPADWVGIRAMGENRRQRSQRDGNPESNRRSQHQGAMVEVLVDGQIGYAAINALTVKDLRQAAQSALAQAKAAAPWRIHSFSPTIRPTMQGHYVSTVTQPIEHLDSRAVHDLLTRVCQRLKVSDQIVQARASVLTQGIDTWLVSTSGTDVHQQFSLLVVDFGATAQDGTNVQTRTYNGPQARCYQGGWEHLEQSDDFWGTVHRIGEQAVELLSADECPDTAMTLVLAPDQMLLQIHESIGHPLELDRILGDERNYAGGSFIRPEDFGTRQYGSKQLNVTFDPTIHQEFASYGFDDTGVLAERQYLIKEGVLLRGLGSSESQDRLGIPGVACARAAAWDRPPIDRMANLNIEPGDRTFDELIATVEDGIYMEANRSWSIDDQRFKFQFGCEYAKRIRQGQLAETLCNPNYRSTTPQFWHSLAQVGDRSTWQVFGTPYCGKGEPNQIVRVGHGSPVCAFNNIEVFGGAS